MQYEITAIVPFPGHPLSWGSGPHFEFERRLVREFGGFTALDGLGAYRDGKGEGSDEEVRVYTVLFTPSPGEAIEGIIMRWQEAIIREFRQHAAYVTAREVLGGIKVA